MGAVLRLPLEVNVIGGYHGLRCYVGQMQHDIGLYDLQRFLTGVPFMIKINVAPVSAIECDVANAIAFTHSDCFFLSCNLFLDSIIIVVIC